MHFAYPSLIRDYHTEETKEGREHSKSFVWVFQEVREWLDCQITHGNIQPFFTDEVGMRISAPPTPSHFLMVVLAFLKGYHAGIVKSKENR